MFASFYVSLPKKSDRSLITKKILFKIEAVDCVLGYNHAMMLFTATVSRISLNVIYKY